jgi:hypothetical protein
MLTETDHVFNRVHVRLAPRQPASYLECIIFICESLLLCLLIHQVLGLPSASQTRHGALMNLLTFPACFSPEGIQSIHRRLVSLIQVGATVRPFDIIDTLVTYQKDKWRSRMWITDTCTTVLVKHPISSSRHKPFSTYTYWNSSLRIPYCHPPDQIEDLPFSNPPTIRESPLPHCTISWRKYYPRIPFSSLKRPSLTYW